MKTIDGQEMYLTADAEKVAVDLAALGAEFTSGWRAATHQAHAMAVNTAENRQWIVETYKHPANLQEIVDAHPEAVTAEQLYPILLIGMEQLTEAERQALSHHYRQPCPVFDIEPRFDETGERIKARIYRWMAEGAITQVLWTEGGLVRWHVEVGPLPLNKVMPPEAA